MTSGLLWTAAAALCVPPAWAQWPPLKNAAKPDLKAAAPRTADGKVDFSGIWAPAPIKYHADIAADLKAGDIPFRPEAAQIYSERLANHGLDDPDTRCLPSGTPRTYATPFPFKVLQFPNLIAFLIESRTTFRQVFLDGRSIPQDAQPTWDGYSIGHWEGKDTLVVETAGFNGKAWLDSNGHPMTDALNLTERFRRPDFGRLEIEITIDDPKAYTKRWTVKLTHRLLDTELMEFICNENERDLKHLVGK
jgi:hypothetical protein